MPEPLTRLFWLTLGAFAIGTEGFMIAGLLPALAQDLEVGLSAAGHLVTAFSLAYALGAPVMAVLTAGLERRWRLLGFGLASAAGTRLGSWVAGRWSGRRTVVLSGGLLTLSS
jgi:predicted MFS family arabinose efflux permease